MVLNYLSDSASSISLGEFFQLLGNSHSPILILTILLALGVVFINGWTDAPNSVATCISTRAMSAKSAIIMAAIFNFLGVLTFSLFAAGVAETISGIVDFGSLSDPASQVTNAKNSLVGLSAGMYGRRCRLGRFSLGFWYSFLRITRFDCWFDWRLFCYDGTR